MVNRPRNIGTAAESAIVRVLRENGFPQAERRSLRGNLDCGDITGCGPVVIESKAGKAAETASDGQILAWLAETETERVNARADVGVLVVKRKGVGGLNAERWWAVMTVGTVATLLGATASPSIDPHMPVRMTLLGATRLLRNAGYGDALEVGAA